MLQTYQRTIHQKINDFNVNDFPIDHIDAVDRSTIIDDNNSISSNIPDSIPHNSQQIVFVVRDNIANNNTNSNDNDTLSNMTSMDMLTEVRKCKHKEYISYISTEHSKAPSTLSMTELEVSSKTNNPDNNTENRNQEHH